MLKKNMKALVFNRGDREVGTILKRWRRKDIVYFNVMLERGYLMENLTEDTEKPCYLLTELSEKMNTK